MVSGEVIGWGGVGSQVLRARPIGVVTRQDNGVDIGMYDMRVTVYKGGPLFRANHKLRLVIQPV